MNRSNHSLYQKRRDQGSTSEAEVFRKNGGRFHTLLKILLCATFLFSILSLFACTPSWYSEKEEKAVEETSRELISAWLKTLPEKPELTSLNMMNGAEPGENPYSGYYKTTFSLGTFTAGGRTCQVVVNNADGQLWTDYYEIDLSPFIAAQLKPFAEARGFTEDFLVTGTGISYRLPTESKGRGGQDMTAEVFFSYMLPAEITPENADEKMPEFLQDQWIFRFNVWYTAGENVKFDPQIIMDYLKETGNYRQEDYNEYYMNAVRPEYFESLREEAEAGHADDILGQGPEAAMYGDGGYGMLALQNEAVPFYNEVWYSRMTHENILLEYVKTYYDGPLADYRQDQLEEKPCPVVFEEDGIRCTGENDGYSYLFFTEKPDFTRAFRTYTGSGTLPPQAEAGEQNDAGTEQPEAEAGEQNDAGIEQAQAEAGEQNDAGTEAGQAAREELHLVELSRPGDQKVWSLNNEENRYLAGFYFEPHMPQEIVFEY